MDTSSFVFYIKPEDIYVDTTKDVERRFDTSNYELKLLLPKRKMKKVIGLMKNELRGKLITKKTNDRLKTYSYLINDGNENK